VAGLHYEISAYLDPGDWRAPLYTIAGLSYRSHTFTLTVLGTKEPASCDAWIYVEAFDVEGQMPIAGPAAAMSWLCSSENRF